MLKHAVRVYGTWDLVLWQCGSKMYDTQNSSSSFGLVEERGAEPKVS